MTPDNNPPFLLLRYALSLRGAVKRAARRAERGAKNRVLSLLSRTPAGSAPLSVRDLHDIRRILVIRPNYRIGNAVLSTAIIAPLQQKYPAATIDFLATDKTAGLLQHLPLGKVATLSRTAIFRPWRALALLRELRASHYDLAVQLEDGSLTGLLISRLLGARYVIGKPKGAASWYDLNIRESVSHAYDTATLFARALEVPCLPRPQLALSPAEQRQAVVHLQALNLATADACAEPFVAVFVGGHGDKVCPAEFWCRLSQGLDALKHKFVVFVGPEERTLTPVLEHALANLPHGQLCPPRSLRQFAALLARAAVLITPDSGPMHVAAALQVPIIAMARSPRSKAFIPDCHDTHTVWNLDLPQTLNTVQTAMQKAQSGREASNYAGSPTKAE